MMKKVWPAERLINQITYKQK